MNYSEAKKAVESLGKSEDSYMTIKISYDCTLILPHKDGIAFLNALNHAEEVDDHYHCQKAIAPLKRERLTIQMMPHSEYVRYKIAALLNINIADLESMETAAQKDNTLKEPA